MLHLESVNHLPRCHCHRNNSFCSNMSKIWLQNLKLIKKNQRSASVIKPSSSSLPRCVCQSSHHEWFAGGKCIYSLVSSQSEQRLRHGAGRMLSGQIPTHLLSSLGSSQDQISCRWEKFVENRFQRYISAKKLKSVFIIKCLCLLTFWRPFL